MPKVPLPITLMILKSSILNDFYFYIEYAKNKHLTAASKKEIEDQISQSIRESILLAVDKWQKYLAS